MVPGAQRVPAFPDVPTAMESGLKDFEMTRHYFKLWGDIVKANDIRAE